MSWNLQALDPDTLAPPADPSIGFLPPNQHNPEGDGVVSFSASPTNVPSGATIANRASIEFDSNPLIETEAWTNTIDREPPTASIQAEGTSDPASAHVSWSGSDDASGIALWEIKVAKDGGPYTVWRTAEANGSDTYTATESGTYSFRGVAHDGAGNVTESAQAAVALTTGSEPASNGSPAPTGGKDAPQAQKTAGKPSTSAIIASVNPARLVLTGQGSRFALVLGSGNRLILPIVAKCPTGGASCHLTTTLTAVLGKGHKATKVGGGAVNLKPGGTSSVQSKLLAGPWKFLLKHSRHLTVKIRIDLTRGSETLSRTVTVLVEASKKHKPIRSPS